MYIKEQKSIAVSKDIYTYAKYMFFLSACKKTDERYLLTTNFKGSFAFENFAL